MAAYTSKIYKSFLTFILFWFPLLLICGRANGTARDMDVNRILRYFHRCPVTAADSNRESSVSPHSIDLVLKPSRTYWHEEVSRHELRANLEPRMVLQSKGCCFGNDFYSIYGSVSICNDSRSCQMFWQTTTAMGQIFLKLMPHVFEPTYNIHLKTNKMLVHLFSFFWNEAIPHLTGVWTGPVCFFVGQSHYIAVQIWTSISAPPYMTEAEIDLLRKTAVLVWFSPLFTGV